MKKGFTMAEVLITLAIIGIVAVLTIPTVVRNYQKHQTVVQLKKAYSQLNQALNMSEIDNGPMETWDFTLDPEIFFQNYFKKYLKISQYYGKVTSSSLGATYKEITGNPLSNEFSVSTNVKFVLGDGTLMGLTVKNGGNIMYVDVNGVKPPNKRSRDFFMFTITPYYKVMPYGYGTSIINAGDGFGTTFDRNTLIGQCKKTSGNWCTALIMLDGWEIKDDYPW